MSNAACGGLSGGGGFSCDTWSGGHTVMASVRHVGRGGPVAVFELPGRHRPTEVQIAFVGAVHQTPAQGWQEAARVDTHMTAQLSGASVGVRHICHMLGIQEKEIYYFLCTKKPPKKQ